LGKSAEGTHATFYAAGFLPSLMTEAAKQAIDPFFRKKRRLQRQTAKRPLRSPTFRSRLGIGGVQAKAEDLAKPAA
jgi:hypothetical protein